MTSATVLNSVCCEVDIRTTPRPAPSGQILRTQHPRIDHNAQNGNLTSGLIILHYVACSMSVMCLEEDLSAFEFGTCTVHEQRSLITAAKRSQRCVCGMINLSSDTLNSRWLQASRRFCCWLSQTIGLAIDGRFPGDTTWRSQNPISSPPPPKCCCCCCRCKEKKKSTRTVCTLTSSLPWVSRVSCL